MANRAYSEKNWTSSFSSNITCMSQGLSARPATVIGFLSFIKQALGWKSADCYCRCVTTVQGTRTRQPEHHQSYLLFNDHSSSAPLAPKWSQQAKQRGVSSEEEMRPRLSWQRPNEMRRKAASRGHRWMEQTEKTITRTPWTCTQEVNFPLHVHGSHLLYECSSDMSAYHLQFSGIRSKK